MVSFFFRLLFFSMLVVGAIIVPRLFLPTYWGNEGHAVKMPYVESHEEINPLFIGSSRTQFHIDPLVFDSVTGKTQSFNLGYSSTRGEESMFFLEDLLAHENFLQNIDYIFLEVRPLFYDELLYKNLRGKYQLNKDRLIFLQSYFRPINDFATKDLSKSYIESLLGIGMVRDEWSQLAFPSMRLNKSIAFFEKRGFANRKKAIESDQINSNLVAAGIDFTDKLDDRRDFALRCYEADKETISASDALYVERLNALHDDLSREGVALYFIPTLRFENTPLPNLFRKLNQGDLYAETSNPKRYPEFYSPEFSGDAAHLNLQGARLYSTVLADLFLSISATP